MDEQERRANAYPHLVEALRYALEAARLENKEERRIAMLPVHHALVTVGETP
jgi:hypothetical protein